LASKPPLIIHFVRPNLLASLVSYKHLVVLGRIDSTSWTATNVMLVVPSIPLASYPAHITIWESACPVDTIADIHEADHGHAGVEDFYAAPREGG
jgi:hypothetical protein